MADAFRYFLHGFTPFLDRGSALFWPFLLSTAVAVALFWRFSGIAWADYRRLYLGRSLWWHASARADYGFYLVNAVIYPLLVGPALVGGGAIATGLGGLLKPILGTPHGLAASGWPMKVLFTVAIFLAYDFGRFVSHSLLHDVPVLWDFHKVHHSAEVLTPFTGFRVHPVDLALIAWTTAITTGSVIFLFQWLGGPSLTVYEFLGTQALLWLFNLLGNLKHWQAYISYGPVLDRWLIAPAHHRLHHSAEPQHFGRNRGFELTVWDRLYGSFALPRRDETFRMGLGDGSDGRWHAVWKLYLWPFGLAARRLVPAERPRSTSAPR